MKYCSQCGHSIDEQDMFCRNCGVALTKTPGARHVPVGLSPEIAASYWKNFFGPFFKVAFIFFACFFGISMLLVLFWFFMFRS